MELQKDFVPEARRLLKLARDDRKAARAALAALPIEQQATVVVEAPLGLRAQLLDLVESPEEIVPLLPEAELCFTAKAIGIGDAGWLVELATPEQVVACFDLDAWRGLELDHRSLDEWFAVLVEGEPERVLPALQSLDPELLSLHLRDHLDVELKPSPQDDPDWQQPEGSQTLEGQFYFTARRPDDDVAPLVTLLRTLFEGDYWLYFRMMQSVREELDAETREWALRWRTGRLEDLGFPSWDTAMRIYGHLRPDALATIPEDDRPLDIDSWALPVWITELPQSRNSELPLFQGVRELVDEERASFFYAFVGLANRVAVADRKPLGDATTLPETLEKAAEVTNRGLEYVASENGIKPTEILRRVSVERLYRVGVNLAPEGVRPPPLYADDVVESEAGEGSDAADLGHSEVN